MSDAVMYSQHAATAWDFALCHMLHADLHPVACLLAGKDTGVRKRLPPCSRHGPGRL
jgi:hypothetical protein